jgi:hypothetical protein
MVFNTRVAHWVIPDDIVLDKPVKPLKTNDPEKRRNHRQKSSEVVKTKLKPLISLKVQ